MLILGPIMMASINISLRHMRQLHELTASSYTVIFSLIFYGILMPATGQKFTIFSNFHSYEHVLLLFISLSGGIGMLCKTKAL